MSKKQKIPFDKYWHYRHSVQSPDVDVRFMQKCYRQSRKKSALVFREDFSSTFALSCEWVKMGKNFKAACVDIDSEPLEYGKTHYLSTLTPHQQKRIRVINSNVLKPNLPKADIVGVLNFSYSILKTRSALKQYFLQVLRALNPKGVFILDCFGGSDCLGACEEKEVCEGVVDEPLKKRGGAKKPKPRKVKFTYFWDQKDFDPITHHAMFYIHYKRRGEKKRNNVFTYNWRLWSLPEIKDLLEEVGFKKVHVYWEGTNKKGEGDGKFVRSRKGEECEAFVAYIVAEK